MSFAVSPACFVTARALEQIKNDVCYSDVPATIVGISAGVSYGALGSTHHSLHDLAALRAVHNITLIVPADNFETREAVRFATQAEHPVYLRFGKAAMYDLYNAANQFEVGKAIKLREGTDLAFIATGETVIHALLAAGRLAELGIECRVLSMHTVKPLDTEAVIRAGQDCGAVIAVEEHSVHGGLGEACAAVLLQAGLGAAFRIVGIPDEDTVTGSQADIFRHYGLTMEGLTTVGQELVSLKRSADGRLVAAYAARWE
jgi:transketolase